MNGHSALTPQLRRELNWRVLAWSDGPGYHEANRLAESYRHLLPKPVTNAQLNGLRNIAASASTLKDMRDFTQNQAGKAERRGDFELRDYWNAVEKALNGLGDPAGELWRAAGGSTENLPMNKTAPDSLHLRLVREFVQHLLAHSAFMPMQQD